MISVGAVMFIRSRGVKPEIEEVTEVPDWGTPVKVYVQECIKSVGKDGVLKLGQHGGFIDPYDSELSGRYFNIDLKKPTESDAVPLTPLSDTPVVYWWHIFSNRIEALSWPSLASMKKELNLYIERNIDSCLKDFESFKAQGFDIERIGDIKVETTITPANVLFKLIYPIRIKKDEQSIDLATYRESIDVKLREIYKLAYEIFSYEAGEQFLETVLMEFINSYSGVSINKLPPIAYTDTKMYTISWPMDWVEKMFKDKLMSFIQYIKVEGTKGATRLVSIDPLVQSIYNRLFIDVTTTEATHPRLRVDFLYLNWPIHFDINPRSGNTIVPDIIEHKIGVGLLSFGPTRRTNEYSFAYDVSFPVIVKIRDDDAFHGEGYTFFFALEGNIRGNRDFKQIAAMGGTLPQSTVTNYTDPAGNVVQIVKKLFCNDIQRIIPVRVLTKDARTHQPLEDVEVIYECGTFQSCSMGVTGGYDSDKNAAYLEGKFPVCNGGYLLLKKQGYLDEPMLLSTLDPNNVEEVVAYLEPIREKPASLVPYRMSLPNSCCTPGAPLKDGEMAMITVSKVVDPNDPYDQPLDTVLVFSEGGSEQKVKLVPGWYEVNGMYFNENTYTIYKHSQHMCDYGIIGASTADSWDYTTNTPRSACFGDECEIGEDCWGTPPAGTIKVECCDSVTVWIPDDDIEMNPLGGVRITEENGGAWRIYKAELDDSNEVEFHVIIPPDATCVDTDGCLIQPAIGMGEAGRVDEYSVTYRDRVEPKFK